MVWNTNVVVMIINFLYSGLGIFLFLIVDVTSWGSLLHYPEYQRSVEPQQPFRKVVFLSFQVC